MRNCNCEHWEICPTCQPERFDADGKMKPAPPSMSKQAHRLYQVVERLALRADVDVNESIDWLCDKGGMFELYQTFFGPKHPPRQPLTDEEIVAMWQESIVELGRAIERAHGIGGEA